MLPPVYEEGQIAAEQGRPVAEILAGWREEYPDVDVEVDTVRSGAANRLVELSATERLPVVGRGGTPDGPVGRPGSVSQAVVHHSRCPVAVVPPTTRADGVLRRSMRLAPDRVTVDVADGVVTLRGELDLHSQVVALLRQCWAVAVVVAVHDQFLYVCDDREVEVNPATLHGLRRYRR